MNNLECTLSILEGHREARHWSDRAVAKDLLAQLGLDPKADAKHPKPRPDPDETAVLAAEEAAREATEKAKAARAKLDAQKSEHSNDDAKGGQAKSDAGHDDKTPSAKVQTPSGQTEKVGHAIGIHPAASLQEAEAASAKSQEATAEAERRSRSEADAKKSDDAKKDADNKGGAKK